MFLEISADMLKFVPFAEKAGLHFIGNTQGNLQRVAKDIGYLTKNAKRVRNKEIVQEKACGIVDQQVKRMEQALLVMRRNRIPRADFVERLTGLTASQAIKDFALFSEIVSLPKPSYMGGLNGPADRFVRSRVKALKVKALPRPQLRRITPVTSSIVFDGVAAAFVSRVRHNVRTHAVQQAFGISPDRITATVLSGLNFTIRRGETVLVTGPSGAGKSVLLDLIQGKQRKGLIRTGKIDRPDNALFGNFSPLSSTASLVELFGRNGVADGLDLLSRVGLSDAFIFLRRFNQLSMGQQHRAMLADVIRQKANIALIDEFCSALDPVTANVVAQGIRRLVQRLGITLVVAASHYEGFIDSLRPDKVLELGSYGEFAVRTGTEFTKDRRDLA
jgi:ABC-type phosphate/phosphonate transport system ATPase subunit